MLPVLGSRDTQFVSEITELGGASVVLNSLTSSGMVAGSLAALQPGGRFVEISKRDIWSAARVAQGKFTFLMAVVPVVFVNPTYFAIAFASQSDLTWPTTSWPSTFWTGRPSMQH